MASLKTHRKLHYWGAIITALPLLIMLVSGLLLMLKKDISWIQPPSQRGTVAQAPLDLEKLLLIAQTYPQLQLGSWDDVNRLDVRPGRSLVKLRANNGWELQMDWSSGEVLHLAYRRSDVIEALHDGSFFHDGVKYGVFLPASFILLGLWITGLYLWFGVNRARRIKAQRGRLNRPVASAGRQ